MDEQQPIAPQQQPQQTMPVTTMPVVPQPLSPYTPKKASWVVLVVILFVIFVGSYAGAAFYFQLWPFQGAGPLSKQLAFANLFSKIQMINSATYEAQVGIQAEAREAGATAFEPVTFPEFEAETKMYQNDQNRVRDLQEIQAALAEYHKLSLVYPAQLSSLASLTPAHTTDFTYTPKPEADNYILTVTFETDDAVKAVNYSTVKDATKVDGKTVAFSKGSGTYFYFYGEPQKPYWVTALEDGGDSYLEYAPSDFTLNLTVGGTSQKNQDKAADANFHLGGAATFGDFNVAADVEVRKKADVYYGEITKFPSLFLDLSAIKNTWVKVTPDDLINYGDLPYVATFVGDKQKKNSRALEQIQTIFKTMDEDKVLSVDFSLPDEMIGKDPEYVYAVTYDETKVVPWYEHLSKVMKDTYGDDAMIKLDETSLKYMKSDSFQKYLAYIKNNTTMHIVVDKKSGFPIKIEYRFRVVPSDKVTKLKDKQFSLNLGLTLSNINTPIVVEEPKNAISFEDAQLALTGQTHEEYQFNKQRTNIETIQSSLAGYHEYTGVYPDTLDQLTTPRGQLQKAPPKPSSSGGVSIDFPASFSGFSDSGNSEYETQLALQPFLKTVPKDIFTSAAYTYAKNADGKDYTLRYSMTIPKKSKTASAASGGGILGSYQSFGVNDAVSFVNGTNTASAKVLSTEAQAALKIDTDKDGLPDIVEAYYGSDPNKKDSDGDGYTDGDEVKKGYDPAGPGKLDYNDIWYSSYSSSPDYPSYIQ